MYRKVEDILFCKRQIKEEVAKYPSDIVKHRIDIGNDFFETPNIKYLCDIFHKVTNNEIKLKLDHEHMIKKETERNNMKRKVEDEPNTQPSKKQKSINTVAFEFKFNQPAVFHAGTATVNSSVGKSIYHLFPQQRN
jgi:hypothetical protein